MICLRFDPCSSLGSSSWINFCLFWIIYLTPSSIFFSNVLLTRKIFKYSTSSAITSLTFQILMDSLKKFLKKISSKGISSFCVISLKFFLWTSFNAALVFTAASCLSKRAYFFSATLKLWQSRLAVIFLFQAYFHALLMLNISRQVPDLILSYCCQGYVSWEPQIELQWKRNP